jgi:hypothetical protein
MNFKGTIAAKRNVQCAFCGNIVGPNRPVKMMYVQYGAGAGNFCSDNCTRRAYESVVEKHPELVEKEESIFKGVNG